MGFIYCVNCGNILDEDAVFCGLCGTEVGVPVQTAEQKEAEKKQAEKEAAERKAAEERAARAVAEAAKREAERKETEQREAEKREAERREAERKASERKKTEAAQSENQAVKMNSRSAAQMIPICSFCGKTQKEVHWLIRGNQAYICDECIDDCAELIEQKRTEAGMNVRRFKKSSSSMTSMLDSMGFWSGSDDWFNF